MTACVKNEEQEKRWEMKKSDTLIVYGYTGHSEHSSWCGTAFELSLPRIPLLANPHGVVKIDTPKRAFMQFATTETYSESGNLLFDILSMVLVLLNRKATGHSSSISVKLLSSTILLESLSASLKKQSHGGIKHRKRNITCQYLTARLRKRENHNINYCRKITEP